MKKIFFTLAAFTLFAFTACKNSTCGAGNAKQGTAENTQPTPKEKARIKQELEEALSKVTRAVAQAFLMQQKLTDSKIIQDFRNTADKHKTKLGAKYDEIKACKLVAAYNKAMAGEGALENAKMWWIK